MRTPSIEALKIHFALLAVFAVGGFACGSSTESNYPDAAIAADAEVPETPSFAIGGSVIGLDAGDTLVLLLNEEQAIRITANGDFSFARGLAEGASFSVQPLVNPDGKNCTVEGGIGTVADAVISDVAVACVAANTQLLSLDVTPSFPVEVLLTPSFSPNTLRYSLSLPYLIDEASFSLSSEDPTSTVFLNGEPVSSGVASPQVPLAPGGNQVIVRVQSTTGESQLYFIDVLREQPKILASGSTSDVAIDGDVAVLALPFDSEGGPIGGDVGGLYVYQRDQGSWQLDTFIQATESTPGLGSSGRIILKDDTILACNPLAPDPDTNEQRGAVYVFKRTNGIWAEEAVLRASNGDAGDQFGFDASVFEDTIVVGAPRENSSATGGPGDNSALFSGAAYVFRRVDGIWIEEAILKASNAEAQDEFGSSVAIWGPLVAVGAPGEDSLGVGVDGDKEEPGPGDVGAVYLYELTNAVWEETVYVKTLQPLASRRFGLGIELRDSLLIVSTDQDKSSKAGINDPAPGTTNVTGSGAVFSFRKAGGTWSQDAYIKASNPGIGFFFGCDISLNRVGDTLVVGSHGEKSHATGIGDADPNASVQGAGAVYLFRFYEGAWHEDKYAKVPVFDSTIKRFGTSVAYDSGTLLVAGTRTFYFY